MIIVYVTLQCIKHILCPDLLLHNLHCSAFSCCLSSLYLYMLMMEEADWWYMMTKMKPLTPYISINIIYIKIFKMNKKYFFYNISFNWFLRNCKFVKVKTLFHYFLPAFFIDVFHNFKLIVGLSFQLSWLLNYILYIWSCFIISEHIKIYLYNPLSVREILLIIHVSCHSCVMAHNNWSKCAKMSNFFLKRYVFAQVVDIYLAVQ